MPRYMCHAHSGRTEYHEADSMEDVECFEGGPVGYESTPPGSGASEPDEGGEDPGGGGDGDGGEGDGGGDTPAPEFDVAGSTIPEVITWVEADPSVRVSIALDAEQSRGDAARSSLVAALQGMIVI